MDPWFKFYAADYLLDEDVDMLPLEAQAILLRLWCLCWRSITIPDNPEVLAKRTKVDPKTMRKHWPNLRGQFFQETPEGFVSPRLEKERAESRAITESRRLGAQKTNEKRYGKRSLSESLSESLSDTASVRSAARPANALERHADDSVSESESESEKETNVETPAEPATRPPRKVAPKKPAADSLPEILGKGTLASLWDDFWTLSGIWPETSNIRKKDSARAYVEARKNASHECIYAWAEWTLEQSGGKITTLAAWLSNQDWQGRQEQRSRLAATA